MSEGRWYATSGLIATLWFHVYFPEHPWICIFGIVFCFGIWLRTFAQSRKP